MNTTKRTASVISFLLAMALLLSACAGIQPGGAPYPSATAGTPAPTGTQAAPAPEVTATPSATAAVSPSPVPSPSMTDAATPTPEATPEPTASPDAAISPDPSATADPTASADLSATADSSATPAPTESPAPAETQVPSEQAAPAASHAGDRPDVTVVKYYESTLPDSLSVNLKYKTYSFTLDYFVVLKSSAVRELPDAASKSLLKVKLANRLSLLAQVNGADGKVWYRVDAGKNGIGYIPASAGNPRFFQVDKAMKEIAILKEMTDESGTVRIANYKNKAGKPPKLPGNKEVDKYGNRRDQAATAYLAPDKSSSFCYMPDGSLGQSLGTVGDFIQIYFPRIDEVRYVPKKYVSAKKEAVSTLSQAIIVDRKNQNIMTLEYANGAWSISSMCYVSTGKNGGYSLPTPLGYFAAIEKKRPGKYNLGEFWFLADGADPNDPNVKFSGYAPYAIRFTGGAYLHGLPVSVHYDPVTNLMIDPGGRTYESSTCLGTTPQSHMCVRNYTSHAKYMYKWVKIGEAAVIVIE